MDCCKMCEGWKADALYHARRAEAAEAKCAELERKTKQIHKDLGHELRDPYGTIWEEAARLQNKCAAMEKVIEEAKDYCRYRSAHSLIAKDVFNILYRERKGE